jgi:hypothetical protein
MTLQPEAPQMQYSGGPFWRRRIKNSGCAKVDMVNFSLNWKSLSVSSERVTVQVTCWGKWQSTQPVNVDRVSKERLFVAFDLG